MKSEAKHIIVGIHVTDRVKHAGQVQQVLTGYGANIKTRLGLHEADGKSSSPNGVILLEMVGDEKKCCSILGRLNAIRGIQAKKIIFAH
jgi:hypothetical protein